MVSSAWRMPPMPPTAVWGISQGNIRQNINTSYTKRSKTRALRPTPTPPLNWHRGNIWRWPTTMTSLRPTPCTPWVRRSGSCVRQGSRTASCTATRPSLPKRSKSRWWPTSSPIMPRIICSAATTSAIWPCSGGSCSSRQAGNAPNVMAVRTTTFSSGSLSRWAVRPMCRRCSTTGGCTKVRPPAAPMPSLTLPKRQRRRWPTIWSAPAAPVP